MGKAFMCSLCRNGILGGGLYLDDPSAGGQGALIYRTQKLTVDEKYRNLVLPLQEIRTITWKWIVFPVATFHMKNGEEYKMIIFNKRRFSQAFEEERKKEW